MTALALSVRKRRGDFSLDVDVHATAGVVALFGRSGCGKSTAVDLLAGLLRADSGRIQIGDDVHMRTQGTTSLLMRNLLPQIAALPDDGRVALAEFLSANHLFFLNLAMAAAKSAAMWAEQVEGASIVTMMCRNGTSYGIRLAGWDEVFIARSPAVQQAMYYPESVRSELADYLAAHRRRLPGDILIREWCLDPRRKRMLYMLPGSVVQHVGTVSTGVAGCDHQAWNLLAA